MLVNYYLLKPNDSLLNRAKASSHEWAELLTETVLWTRREGDRTTWSEEDRGVLVKLLFLASVWELSGLPDFREIVGSLSLDTDSFDKNWTLQQIDEVDDVDDVAKRLAGTVLNEQVHTGRPLVDEWLRAFGVQSGEIKGVGSRFGLRNDSRPL
jgi:hypothetical protein